LVRFHSVSAMNIPQVGDTVILNLMKREKDNFIGHRIFLNKSDEEFGIEPFFSWGEADFRIIKREEERIMTSIIENLDTIYFYKY